MNKEIDKLLTKDLLQEEYKTLRSMKAIGIKYGVSETAIKNRFVKFKIPYIQRKNKYDCNHNIFSEESERAFYLAGFIAADGCVRIAKTNKNKDYVAHRLVISLSIKDYDFLLKLRDLMGCENPVPIYEHKLSLQNPEWNDIKVGKLSITSKQMVADLEQFGVVPRKTFILDFPDWLIEHPLAHHFIRGYIDGDGSFFAATGERHSMVFALRGTLQFLNKIKEIFIQKFELDTDSIPRIEGGIGNFRFTSNEMIARLTDYLYRDATIFLQRKYDRALVAGKIIKIQENSKKEILKILNEIV